MVMGRKGRVWGLGREGTEARKVLPKGRACYSYTCYAALEKSV